MVHKLISRLGLCALLLALPGCALLAPARTPMETLHYRQAEQRNTTLFVLLPGRHNGADRFAREGFVEAVRRRNLPVDIVATDATIGYYVKQQLLPRLKADVIEPARREGYRTIWLVGVSMGGMGAIWYSREHLDDLAGMVLIAPFLGDSAVYTNVADAGGIRHWQQPPETRGSYQWDLWTMIKWFDAPARSTDRLFLAYGTGDDFAAPNGILGAILPAGQVIPVEGGHDWPTWRTAWERILDRLPVPRNPVATRTATGRGDPP